MCLVGHKWESGEQFRVPREVNKEKGPELGQGLNLRRSWRDSIFSKNPESQKCLTCLRTS